MESKPLLKILHVYKDFDPPVQGGIEGHVARCCRYQQAWGDVSALTCSRSWYSRVVEHDGVRVTEVGEWGRFLGAPVSPRFPEFLRREHADVTVIHIPNPTAEIAWLLARSSGALVVRYHSDVVRQARSMRFYGPIQQRLLARATLILPTSPQYLATSTTLAPHRARCRVVPLGIDAAAFQQPDAERVAELHRKYPEPFVFFCGKHRYYKGLDTLVAAAPAIKAPVVVAGDGPERPRLEAMAGELGGQVHFPGALSHKDLVAHLHACALFVFPSTARSEAFGVSIMEAHAAGKPVVATRLGTGVELINEDQQTGLNVAPGDPGALAEAVNALLDNPGRRNAMGLAAQIRVTSKFDGGQCAKEEWLLYQEATQ